MELRCSTIQGLQQNLHRLIFININFWFNRIVYAESYTITTYVKSTEMFNYYEPNISNDLEHSIDVLNITEPEGIQNTINVIIVICDWDLFKFLDISCKLQ